MPHEDVDPQTLDPSESTDSDEVRNDDGDTVVDPPMPRPLPSGRPACTAVRSTEHPRTVTRCSM